MYAGNGVDVDVSAVVAVVAVDVAVDVVEIAHDRAL